MPSAVIRSPRGKKGNAKKSDAEALRALENEMNEQKEEGKKAETKTSVTKARAEAAFRGRGGGQLGKSPRPMYRQIPAVQPSRLSTVLTPQGSKGKVEPIKEDEDKLPVVTVRKMKATPKGKVNKGTPIKSQKQSDKKQNPVGKAAAKQNSNKNIPKAKDILKNRLSDDALGRIQETFGDNYVNGSGALKLSSEWDAIVSLGQRHFGAGRWLPKLNLGSGSCTGVSWKLSTVLGPESSTFGELELRNAYFVMRYPSGRTAEVLLRTLLDSTRLAEYGDFYYYASAQTGSSAGSALIATASDSVRGMATSLGTGLSYMLTGKFIYTIDKGSDLIGGPMDRLAGVVPVPRELVDKLSSRATGRVRNAALLRDLLRHANILVDGHSMVPRRLSGITASKLAFIALTHSRNLESMMYRNLIPGALAINEQANRAWSGELGFSQWLLLLTKRTMMAAVVAQTAVIAARASNMPKTNFYRLVGTNSVYMYFEKFIYRIARRHVSAIAGVANLLANSLPIVSRLLNLIPQSWSAKYDNMLRYVLSDGIPGGTLLSGILSALGIGLAQLWVKFLVYCCSSKLFQGSMQQSGQRVDKQSVESQPARFLGVVSEEIFKRAHPSALAAVVAVEAIRCRFDVRYIATAVMHVATAAMPLATGTIVHYLFNIVAPYAGMLTVRNGRMMFPEEQYGAVSEESKKNQCVDEYKLRQNEELAEYCTLVMPKCINPNGRCLCIEPKASIQYSALRVESVPVKSHRACLCNERAAITSRVTSRCTEPNVKWTEMWSIARKMPVVICPDYAEWLSHLPTRARGLLTHASSIGPSEGSALTIKAFIKREKHIESVDGQTTKTDRVPRLIQGRSLSVKIDTGPFTWRYGQKLKQVYGAESNFVYGGGMSAEQIGDCYEMIPLRAAVQGAGWHAIDCKRFDRSIGPSPLLQLYLEYKKIGAPLETLLAFSNRHGVQSGKTQNGIRYKRRAEVNSGDGDTSAGNSRIHLVLLESCPDVYGAIVHGDDAVIYTDNILAVCEWYRGGDLDPVLAPDIDFCSGLFYPTADGVVLGPKIGRVIAKTFQALNKFEDYDPWLRGVLLSIRSSCSFVPILRVIVETLLERVGHGKVYRKKSYEYKSMANRCHECSHDTFVFFEKRYGLSEADCYFYEAMLKSTLEIGMVLTDQVFIDLVYRDVIGERDYNLKKTRNVSTKGLGMKLGQIDPFELPEEIPVLCHELRVYNWKNDNHDSRDFKFKLRKVLPLPEFVDLRELCPGVYDQGALGSCTANAIAAAYQFDENNLICDFTPSRLFIYYNERRMEHTLSSDAGALIRDGIKTINRNGVCPEDMWPYDISKFDKHPPSRCYKAAMEHKAVEYARVNQNLGHLKTCLARGYPIIFGFQVFEGFDKTGVTGVLEMPGEHDICKGGHAVLAVGFDNSRESFIIRNSYGPEWGIKGHFYMPYSYVLNKDYCNDFWVIQKVVDGVVPLSANTKTVRNKTNSKSGKRKLKLKF